MLAHLRTLYGKSNFIQIDVIFRQQNTMWCETIDLCELECFSTNSLMFSL